MQLQLPITLEKVAELDSSPIIVESVSDGILQEEIPGSDIVSVRCVDCNREIWTQHNSEGLKFICGSCLNENWDEYIKKYAKKK